MGLYIVCPHCDARIRVPIPADLEDVTPEQIKARQKKQLRRAHLKASGLAQATQAKPVQNKQAEVKPESEKPHGADEPLAKPALVNSEEAKPVAVGSATTEPDQGLDQGPVPIVMAYPVKRARPQLAGPEPSHGPLVAKPAKKKTSRSKPLPAKSPAAEPVPDPERSPEEAMIELQMGPHEDDAAPNETDALLAALAEASEAEPEDLDLRVDRARPDGGDDEVDPMDALARLAREAEQE